MNGKTTVAYSLKYLNFKKDRPQVYIGRINNYSTIPYKDLVIFSSKAAHVPESSIACAMDALFDVMSYFVCNGHSVFIPNLGSFRLEANIRSTEDPVTTAREIQKLIRSRKIRFIPCAALKEEIMSVKLHKKVK